MDLKLEDMKLRHRLKMYPPKVSVMVYKNEGSDLMATDVTMEILGAEINDINVAVDFSAGTLEKNPY